MKILLATYWAIPHLGGVWNYMVQTKGYLEALGHEVDLLGYGADNTYIHMVNQDRKIKKEDLLPLVAARVSKQEYPEIYENSLVEYTEIHRYCFELGAAYLGLDGYDIIHTQDVLAATCIERVKPAETPLVATLHGSVAHEIRRQLKTIHKSPNAYIAKEYYDALERMGGQSADKTVVANNWLKDILMDEFGVAEEQLEVMHYGYIMPPYDYSKMNDPVEKPKGKKVILYSGRLVELKGVNYLLEALALMKETNQDWVCWIAGDGEQKPELSIETRVLGLRDDVKFLGIRDDLPLLLEQADVFVLPSLIENQPLSVIEAQLMGKAIAVSETGGLPEMVQDGVTGLLFPPENAEKMAEVLLTLIDCDDLRERLGKAARDWGRIHWDLGSGVRKLINLYGHVMNK
ncbi:glycosyltransferase [Bacillus mangrovi]|uniref:Glycosyltransferase n=1 Tax=Metabacillus mangrovi TaxID=1491830 RepID=A0A7X2S2L9_9BACI|nr:glycosyltransferase family 4 protein [Metabacillus mangrovi]MTH52043.1 glycosyltransferase [Metabacillus mangrovi]